MMKKKRFAYGIFKPLVGLCIGLLLSLQCSPKDNPKNHSLKNNGNLKLPAGFISTVVAESVGEGRHIVVNTNGDIYVSLNSLKNGKGIVALRDTNHDGHADVIRYFGKYSGTGIGIHNGFLYFGADTIIVRYKLKQGELIPEEQEEIVAHGFEVTHQHSSKPFTFDNNNNMYVNFGAPSNACQNPDRTPGTPGQSPCPILQRAGGIWRFNADKLNQDQVKDGYRYATGLRNCVAITWNKTTNQLFVVQHGRDQLHEFWPEHYSVDKGVNLPAEEFFRLKDGSDCGWPYCYYDDSINQKIQAPEYGGNGKIQGDCANKQQPIMAFPAHYAPNDLVFYTGSQFPAMYANGAFIVFHGSWNRAPEVQKGFNVVFVPFQGDSPTGKWSVFADGFAGMSTVKNPGDAKYRPCGIAADIEGSLYIVEDNTGKIWKITYHNKQ